MLDFVLNMSILSFGKYQHLNPPFVPMKNPRKSLHKMTILDLIDAIQMCIENGNEICHILRTRYAKKLVSNGKKALAHFNYEFTQIGNLRPSYFKQTKRGDFTLFGVLCALVVKILKRCEIGFKEPRAYDSHNHKKTIQPWIDLCATHAELKP